jgi:vitamin B12 transporter
VNPTFCCEDRVFCFPEGFRGWPAGRGFSVKAQVILVGLLVSISISSLSASQEVALKDTVYSVPEILVEAERISDLEAIKNRPAFVTIIPVDDASRRVSSAADYLAQAVGVHVQSMGGYGAYSTASVRGSSSKQVQVFIDGVPLSQVHSGVVDLADLPMTSVERIEVYRGFGPYDLSGSTIGGVINVVTKKPGSRGRGMLSAAYASLGTKKYEATYGLSRSGFDLLATGSSVSSKGDFDFLDNNGTPYNPDDDEMARRVNNDLTEYEGLLKATGPLRNGILVLSNQCYRRRQGLPGYSAVQSLTERFTKTYNLFHLGWQRRIDARSPVEIRIGMHHLYKLDHFEDRRPKKAGVKPDEKDRTTSLGADLRWQIYLPRLRQSLRGLVSMRREAFQPVEIFLETHEGETQTRTTGVLTLEDEIYLADARIRLLSSIRYERYTDHTLPFESVRADMASYFRNLKDARITHSITSASFGLVISPGAGLTLKANVGRQYRVPTLMELFGYRGLVVPNPDLRPEVGLNRDLGFGFERSLGGDGTLAVEYARFWSDVEHLIMFVYVPFAQAARATNIDEASIDGHEVAISCRAWRGLNLAGNLTLLRAIDTGPITYLKGKHLPNRPEVEASAGLDWTHGGVTATYRFDYIGGNYWNAYNGKTPDNTGPLFCVRRIHTAALTVPTGLHGTDFTLEVRNLTDERFEDVMGFPLPGRSVSGALSVEF